MKTLTKILSVTALIVLCVCLFTVSAFALDLKPVNQLDPTCTKPGYSAHYEDADGNWYDSPTATEAKPKSDFMINPKHKPVEYPAVTEATCKEGTHPTYYKCSVCGWYCKEDGSDTTPAPNTATEIGAPAQHQAAAGSEHAQELPTCGRDGNIKYYICKWCKGYIASDPADTTIPSVTIPATGIHDWGPWVEDEPATETRGGTEKRTCNNCTAEEYRQTRPKGVDPEPKDPDITAELTSVIPVRDTWFRGEETLLFRSDLIKWLNDRSSNSHNRVGLRIGNTRSLYDSTYYTFDFWSWDDFVEFGDKMLNGLEEGTYYLWIYDRDDPDRHTDSVPFYVVDVPTLEPYSTDKHVVNSSKSLRFVASEEIDPNSVKVGSKKLYDSNDYFVSNDRKNITLSPDFLNARQTGTYTISALTKDGRTIKTNFYILSTAQASSSPRTGDESQIGLWAAFLLLSGAAIVVMVPKLRKHGVK